MMKFVVSFVIGLLLGPATLVAAHDPGLSSAEVRLGADRIVVRLVFSRLEIETLGQSSEPWQNAFEIALDGHAVAGRVASSELDASDALHLQLVFAARPASRLEVRSSLLPKLARGHRQYVSILDRSGAQIAERVLDAQNTSFGVSLESTSTDTGSSSFGEFLLLGLTHILTGYDHLLFLLGLLIAGGSFSSIVRIITSFTLAHSITLALGAFDLVRIPPGVVEPLIAASILYIGLENLFRRDPKHRPFLTFLFGLVHGLGFASALRELGIGAMGGAAAIPLFAFNLGVELGQLAMAVLALPLIWRGSRLATAPPRLATACSLLVALAGAFWLLERTFS